MKSAELKKDATYIFCGGFSNQMLQFIEKNERPRRWIFKRLHSFDPLTGKPTTGTQDPEDNNIWSLFAHDLKKLCFECNQLGLKKTG